jgi:hypothetical protein
MENSKIEWAAVPGHPLYRVSKDGQIQCCAKRVGLDKGRGTKIVAGQQWYSKKPSLDERGYLVTTLGRKSKSGLHRLVLLAFVGPPPPGMECRHLDGNPLNNCLENLEWGTPLENHADQVRHGTRVRGERHPQAKISDAARAAIKQRYAAGALQKDLGKEFGLTQSTISYLINH